MDQVQFSGAGTDSAAYNGATMNAEIIAVGTELLLGHTVNTNAAWLSRLLAGLGIHCFHQTVVGDHPARIRAALQAARARADLVILTGGLGPTVDDVTAAAVAHVLHRPMVHHPALARAMRDRFRRRHVRRPAGNARQAWLPHGARPLPNALGTAPGFVVADGDGWIAALPGVPAEMEAMALRSLVPWVRARRMGRGLVRSRTLKIAGQLESAVNVRVRRWLRMRPPVTVGIYAQPGEVHLRIMAAARTGRAAQRAIARVEAPLRARLGRDCFGADEETLESVVGRWCRQRRCTLAVAESCTGGLVTDRLTDVPGSSAYVRAGVVAYSSDVKQRWLGVPSRVLARHGAVSAPVARAMAQGVRIFAGSDLGVSVTGIAGPTGATRAKPVGVVFIALADGRRTRVQRHDFLGNRRSIKRQSSQAALDLLRRHLLALPARSSPYPAS